SAAVPLISSAVQYNENKKPEANQQVQALVDQKGSLFDNIGGLFSGEEDPNDQKIVSGIFGKNTDQVTSKLAEKSGLSGANISKILGLLGTIVMSFVSNNSNSNSKGGILGQISSAATGSLGGILGNVLG